MTESQSFYYGRAYGFFLQPNRAAEALTLIFICWFMTVRTRRRLFIFIPVVAFLGVLLTTGSKGGFLVGLLVVIVGLWGRTILSTRQARLRKADVFLSAVAPLFIGLLVLASALYLVGAYFKSDASLFSADEDLATRIAALTKFGSAGHQLFVESAQDRFSLQAAYLELIRNRPNGGYGLGASNYLQNQSAVAGTSHHMLLEAALEYGVFYSAAWVLFLLYMSVTRRQQHRQQALGSNCVTQFTLAIFLSFFFSNTVLQSRTVFMTLGAVIYLLFLWKVSSHGEPHLAISKPRQFKHSPAFTCAPPTAST